MSHRRTASLAAAGLLLLGTLARRRRSPRAATWSCCSTACRRPRASTPAASRSSSARAGRVRRDRCSSTARPAERTGTAQPITDPLERGRHRRHARRRGLGDRRRRRRCTARPPRAAPVEADPRHHRVPGRRPRSDRQGRSAQPGRVATRTASPACRQQRRPDRRRGGQRRAPGQPGRRRRHRGPLAQRARRHRPSRRPEPAADAARRGRPDDRRHRARRLGLRRPADRLPRQARLGAHLARQPERRGRGLLRRASRTRTARVWKSGFTSIFDIAFNPNNGTLYVYEIAEDGWLAFEEGFATGDFPPAVLLEVKGNKQRELARGQLSQPGGVAVAKDGKVFVTDGMFTGGRLLRIARQLTAPDTTDAAHLPRGDERHPMSWVGSGARRASAARTPAGARRDPSARSAP